ncbi:nitroreductase/quinone reductase family protein [Streptomyces sp. NPDC058420]|uniref:nitroreductase/quinone reductase family protein n=1 Tax=Streptomyces sp. NPDC058420 TaxID=3346489 RepID=UPI00364C2461
MPHDLNQPIIDEFRANKGRMTGYFEGARLLLTTTGARTGTPHTTPVGYLPDGDRVLVIASAAGSDRHPDWFRNLVAHPQVTVESGVFTYDAQAVVLTGEERDEVFARAVEADPGWAAYQEKTERIIPVVALHSLAQGGPGTINATSFGEAIKVVHDAFRHELALIRGELDKGADTDTELSTLGAQLRVNCLTFCQGLHNHHTGEDTVLFPLIAERHPGSTAALARLREEHDQIATLVDALRETLTTPTDPATTRAEVNRLTTALEAHLTYEEQELIPLFDAAP